MSGEVPTGRLRSFAGLLDEGAARWGGRVAVVDPALGREVTYAGFQRLVDAAAARLLREVAGGGGAAGSAVGDGAVAGGGVAVGGEAVGPVVAVLARNGLEQAVAALACSRAGLVHLGLPVDDPDERLRVVLGVARPRLLLAQPDLADRAAALVDGTADGVPVGSTAVLLDDGPPALADDGTAVLLDDGTDVVDGAATAGEDPHATSSLICTSGSTGAPKLVRLTGSMACTAGRTYTSLLGLGPDDHTAVHLPMWWVSGLVTQLASALASGGAVVTMARWSPSALVDVVARHQVTWLDLVPTLWHGLLREDGFRADRLPTLRAAVFGGAPAAPEVLARVRDRVPGIALLDAYAMSEVPAPIACLVDAADPSHAGTVGTVQPHVRLRLTRSGPGGVDVAPGEEGAVAVRGVAVSPGYLGPDRMDVDADGWFRTGDLGRLDADGYLHLTGRAADVLRRGGVAVHPVEVERALLASGLVEQALVVGVPARLHGEDVAAVVVPVGPAVDVAGLRRAVRRTVGLHAVPVRVLVVDRLPRTGNGKPDRAAARRLLGHPARP